MGDPIYLIILCIIQYTQRVHPTTVENVSSLPIYIEGKRRFHSPKNIFFPPTNSIWLPRATNMREPSRAIYIRTTQSLYSWL